MPDDAWVGSTIGAFAPESAVGNLVGERTYADASNHAAGHYLTADMGNR